jgi:uracil-DNA glycosylase family 4
MASREQKLDYLSHMGIDRWQRRQQQSSLPQSSQNDQHDTQNKLHKLGKIVSTCRACGLCETRTQTVFGSGSPAAKIMFIGEAPGAEEDKQGKPFVGRAGQLLTQMLKAIQLTREEVFIANILKCRPPQNRDPLPEEVAKCTPFLQQQIDLIQPKLLVALGRISAHYLLNTKTALTKLRGQLFEYNNIPLLVTYHPAYLLRAPQEKAKAYEDLKKIQKILL